MTMDSPYAVNAPSSQSAKAVRIDMISGDLAHVIDGLGQMSTVSLASRLAKGGRPQVNEIWTITRNPTTNAWEFTTCLFSQNPIISADLPVGSALDQMVAALAAQGLVTDQANRVIDWTDWMPVLP